MAWSSLQADIMQIPGCFVVLTGLGVVIDSLPAASLPAVRRAHNALLVPVWGFIKPSGPVVIRWQPNWLVIMKVVTCSHKTHLLLFVPCEGKQSS